MMRKVTPFLSRVRGASQLATLGIALMLGACSDTQSAVDASAGQAAGGAAASGGETDVAEGGAGDSGSSAVGSGGDAGDGAAGAAGEQASDGTAGSGGRAANGGSSGAAGSGGSSAPVTKNAQLGAECASDTDCGKGLTCLQPTSTELGGGGPAHGLCTLVCTESSSCGKVKTGAECFDFGTRAYCLESCELGDVLDLADKCGGRFDFVCTQVDAIDPRAFCLPLCRADADCDAGGFCNRVSGLCEKTKTVTPAVGTPCNPNATNPTCVCLRTSADGVTPATGICAELCAGGGGCMFDEAGTQPGGLCVGALSDPFGALDLGYCLPSCDCTSECAAFGNLCRAWPSTNTDFKTYLGKAGLCYDVLAGSTELTCQ